MHDCMVRKAPLVYVHMAPKRPHHSDKSLDCYIHCAYRSISCYSCIFQSFIQLNTYKGYFDHIVL